jgi:hypothetical protein
VGIAVYAAEAFNRRPVDLYAENCSGVWIRVIADPVLPTRTVLPSEADRLPAVSSSFLVAALGFLPADIEISLSGRVTGFPLTIISGTRPAISQTFNPNAIRCNRRLAGKTACGQPDQEHPPG